MLALFFFFQNKAEKTHVTTSKSTSEPEHFLPELLKIHPRTSSTILFTFRIRSGRYFAEEIIFCEVFSSFLSAEVRGEQWKFLDHSLERLKVKIKIPLFYVKGALNFLENSSSLQKHVPRKAAKALVRCAVQEQVAGGWAAKKGSFNISLPLSNSGLWKGEEMCVMCAAVKFLSCRKQSQTNAKRN